jgi:hypothetical protein
VAEGIDSCDFFWVMNDRYGKRTAADELASMYGDTRAKGFGQEVIVYPGFFHFLCYFS